MTTASAISFADPEVRRCPHAAYAQLGKHYLHRHAMDKFACPERLDLVFTTGGKP
jgi:hypothetical protein